jgi:uncharacterized protein (DUF2147 family)
MIKIQQIGAMHLRQLSLAILLIMSAGVASADPIEGLWLTPKGKNGGQGVVQLYKCADLICGKIVQVSDQNNNRGLGLQIVKNMRIKQNGKYRRGRIFAPDRGRWYRAKANLRSQDHLRIGGCWKKICKMQTWKRVDPAQTALN